MSTEKFLVGELCFAKVKGYPPWPAEITKVENDKYEVFFFGTHEIGRIKSKDLFKANDENMEEFCSPKVKSRKMYSEGLEEMKSFLQKKNSPHQGSKHSGGDPNLYPVVLLDTRAVEKANSMRGKSKSKSLPSRAIASSSPNSSSKRKMNASVDPYKRTKASRLRQVKMAFGEESTEEGRIGGTSTLASTNRGSKRQPESSPGQSPLKKSKSSSPEEKVKINISLEMSPELLLRMARELPDFLMSGVNVDTSSNVEK